MKHKVSIVKYEKPVESVAKAIELSKGLDNINTNSRVFIKPNIVFWTYHTNFPKWGVITTSRVVHDMVFILKEHGFHDITIGEGTVTRKPKDTETLKHAFESLGYNILKKRYGVKCVNVMDRPFKKLDLGHGVELNFNVDILNSDFVINLPVMKTHNQTVVSLGIKNLKGTIDIGSRKKCHSADPEKDLNFMVARLADKMPQMFTLIDGIYTNERGPGFDGRMHRTNLLVGSSDVLSADLVGANLLGHNPTKIPHLSYAAKNRNRQTDLSDIQINGEKLQDLAVYHEYDFQYTEYKKDSFLPLPLAKQGITGLSYRKYDLSMCTYCSAINGLVLSAIRYAWKGEPFEDVEILTGKAMKPSPGKKNTILLGKCMCKANKNNPDIENLISVNQCPPDLNSIVKALHKAGINVDPGLFENIDKIPGFFMSQYKDKPEFDEMFYTITLL